jgi:NAD+ synthase (glutamine-hydrolysing)
MAGTLRIALAQLNVVVGDVMGNVACIRAAIHEARDQRSADLVVFSELAVCGYPPEDLLFQAGLRQQVMAALEEIRTDARGIAVLIGYPEYQDDLIFKRSASQTIANIACRTTAFSTKNVISPPATRPWLSNTKAYRLV